MINQNQIIYDVQGDAPDPSIGKENDLALKANITPWKFWRFLSGEWVQQSPPAEKGDKGDDATIEVGDTVTLAPGEPAVVQNVGTPGAAILNFGIPAGAAATVEVDSTVTGASGTQASVENVGDEVNALLKFTIPKGADGTGLGDMLAVNNLSDLEDADAALDNLGGSTLGKSVFTTSTAAGARGVLGRVGVIRTQVFTSSGTYTPDPHLILALIECVGGGGGGGGASSASATQSFGAAGGGSGSYSRMLVTAATIGASKTVTIGAGGNGGAAGVNNGDPGGATSVSTLCVGIGGRGGTAGAISTAAIGGAGGVAGTGDLTAAGKGGGAGSVVSGVTGAVVLASGFGGSSFFRGGAQGVIANVGSRTNGISAGNYESGGGGGGVVLAVNTAAGGNGSAGVIIITEFCSE
jgi:hypothetical protein